MNQPTKQRFTIAETTLFVLFILLVSMLFSMFSRTEPHPPLSVAPFGMGPFLGASIALCIAAFMLGAEKTTIGRVVSYVAVVFALVAFGPHKWWDPVFPKIWPALLLAQLAIAGLIWSCWRAKPESEINTQRAE